MDYWEFIVRPTPSNNVIREMPWWAYRGLRQSLAQELAVSGGPRPREPLSRAGLVIWRYSSGVLDWDNLLGGLKPLIDGLLPPSKQHPQGLGYMADDDLKVLPDAPRVFQCPAQRGKGFSRVRLYQGGLPDEFRILSGGRIHQRWRIPEASPSNNSLRGIHHREYQQLRRKWRTLLGGEPTRAPGKPLTKARLEVFRHSPRSLDWDNAYGGLKPILDCLTCPGVRNPDGMGYLLDDSPAVLEQPILKQLPLNPGDKTGWTEILLWDLTQTEATCEVKTPSEISRDTP
jgi:hypothetical protein